jgi:hypothetical protein
MKAKHFIFSFSLATLLFSCSENQEKKVEAKEDPSALATSYCQCITSSANTDSCGKLSFDYAMKLSSDKESLDLYNKKTEECLMAKLEADMNKVTEAMDELEKKAGSE